MSNTVIQLKYSNVSLTPASLNVGEPAYSFTSDKLFIGNSTNHVLTIGGKYYVDQIEAATDAATGGKLVRRDATGNASFNYITGNYFTGTFVGNADTASKLQTARDIGLNGDATGNVSFDGSQNVTLTVELTNTGVTANTYGGATQIPTFVVDEDGRITSAANVAIATTLDITGDTGTDSISLLTDTLVFTGGDGVTTSIDSGNNAVVFDVDNTVLRTSGGQTIGGDLAITGNLVVTGNTITQDVETVVTEDSLIKLAANNVSDALDIGFYGQYNDGSAKFTGLVRDATDGNFKLFTGETTDPTANVVTYDASNRATLDANITGGTVSGLSSAIAIIDGGTGANTFASGQILLGNGTGALQSLSNTNTAGTYANASHVPVITTDVYGRVSSVTNTAISIDASQISSGLVAVNRGGTNNDTYTSGALLINDGTKITSLANTTYVQTGTLSVANAVSSITVDSYGRLTALTSSAIAIGADQITSGQLTVSRGGTGVGTFTQNGVLLGNGTDALQTASSSTEGHVLTINGSGVPQFQMLSGGTF